MVVVGGAVAIRGFFSAVQFGSTTGHKELVAVNESTIIDDFDSLKLKMRCGSYSNTLATRDSTSTRYQYASTLANDELVLVILITTLVFSLVLRALYTSLY